MPDKKFSVVIPAYNCANSLENLLKDLGQQSYPQELFQILVVDDGSTDHTVEVVKKFGVDLIRHEENRGRVMARESGAREAKYDTLVFIDARLKIEPDLLENADKLNYQPLMGVGAAEKYTSVIDRIFYLIRRRVYQPFEPQAKYAKELWLKPGEFDGRPKGTGVLVIDRKMFLNCALEEKYQDVNDDIKLLHQIVHRGAPILRHTDLTFTYEHRQEWVPLLKHTYFRGPKFLDYYLVPGGPLFKVYVLSWVLLLSLSGFCFVYPMLLWCFPAALLLVLMSVSFWLSEEVGDFFVCLLAFPPLAGAFISGILSAQFSRSLGRREMIQH